MYRGGLDRFKKAQSLEPFSVSLNSSAQSAKSPRAKPQDLLQQNSLAQTTAEVVVPSPHGTQIGGGQSTWQPPDWAIEPRAGVYYLEVVKDGDVLDRISLDKRRHIFGRQFHTCDFVLDHQSVSRQHAAVVPHKNGRPLKGFSSCAAVCCSELLGLLFSTAMLPCPLGLLLQSLLFVVGIFVAPLHIRSGIIIYVIDLGSVHGTFVANERLTKDTPVELEIGQSLRFAASTRSYILRKNASTLFASPLISTEIDLPSPPDPSNEDAVVAYNTILNRYGLTKSHFLSTETYFDDRKSSRPSKRIKKSRVSFKDQVGGCLIEVVGTSDGADVETEPGPIGVKEGSLVGKYESLVQVTLIPKGKEQVSQMEDSISPRGVITDKLQQVMNKVKSSNSKGGIYDDLYGDSFTSKVGSSWAYKNDDKEGSLDEKLSSGKPHDSSADDSDDLFGD
ncbi:nuclear inhibitor of protein phosphatase 1 [Apostasia shenzhenica]|uniref:Nuclear inhibitor of protein phosphatase 1 n=1 Tax=Apostasia shenzhenica TaxID=1088818 RepID=A0A2I0AJV4_9ASPA|nr:nuclear inhibitor of protein phosphatase 1 [Apostasia shenzhenica]